MTTRVYGYYAATEDDEARMFIFSGGPLSLEVLRSDEVSLVELDPVNLDLGASHDKLITDIEAIDGVKSLEMLNPKDEESEGDPLDGNCIVHLDKDGDWDIIMPQIQRVIAEIAGHSTEAVEFTHFTMNG